MPNVHDQPGNVNGLPAYRAAIEGAASSEQLRERIMVLPSYPERQFAYLAVTRPDWSGPRWIGDALEMPPEVRKIQAEMDAGRERAMRAAMTNARRVMAEANGMSGPRSFSDPASASRPGGRTDAQPSAPSGYQFNPVDSATFFAGNYRPQWIVKRLLVAGQPVILGGPRKAMKTSIGIDLAISIDTGTKFLGAFDVYKRLRIAFLSGESGEYAIQQTALRVCQARGIRYEDVHVLWDFKLPQLANPADLEELTDGLRTHEVHVAVIEPLYLCLLAGIGRDVQASNMFDMGPILLAVARACLDVGCTPILGHHSIKSTAKVHEPIELEDLAYSGIPEFARQWLLVNRRERFEPSKPHQLWLSVGGSIGQSGLWAVDIDEGQLNDDFGGRKWEVSTMNTAQAGQAEQEENESHKQQTESRQDKDDETKVLLALDRLTTDATPPAPDAIFTHMRDESKLNGSRARRAINRLVRAGIVEKDDKAFRRKAKALSEQEREQARVDALWQRGVDEARACEERDAEARQPAERQPGEDDEERKEPTT